MEKSALVRLIVTLNLSAITSSNLTSRFYTILIDLGKIRSIKGFCYTPVQEGNTDGTIFHYNLYQSNDGKEWKGIILNGEFSNIKNNPIPQFVTFGKVLETRYLKLEPIEEINGNQKTSIAEFSVVIPEIR